MKNFLLSSLILIISCASYTEKFTPEEKSVESFTPAYLKEFSEASFKITIDAYGSSFGGILAAKKLNENHFRFAFINEFGGKLMDFELQNGEFKLNYAIEDLNRKIILNLLKKDFILLFSEQNIVQQEFTDSTFRILKSSHQSLKQPVYYFLNTETGQLESTVLASRKEKVKIVFSDLGKSIPDMQISHGKLKIKIYLHLLD